MTSKRPALSLLRAIRRSFVSIRRVVEIGLRGVLCAPQAANDLGDRQARAVAIVAGKRRGARLRCINSIADLVAPRRPWFLLPQGYEFRPKQGQPRGRDGIGGVCRSCCRLFACHLACRLVPSTLTGTWEIML